MKIFKKSNTIYIALNRILRNWMTLVFSVGILFMIDGVTCIRCESKNITTYGKNKYGVLYKCKDCKRFFTEKSRVKMIIGKDKRICNCCGEIKPNSEFYINQGNPRSFCKTCYANRPQKLGERCRKKNITEQRFWEMFKEQDEKCCICGNTFPSFKKAFIDHCHKTGTVRGLLCGKCNSLLGFSYDNIDKLTNCINYLKKHSV